MKRQLFALSLLAFIAFASCSERSKNSEFAMSDTYKLSWWELVIEKRKAKNGDANAVKSVYLYYSIYLQDSDAAEEWISKTSNP